MSEIKPNQVYISNQSRKEYKVVMLTKDLESEKIIVIYSFLNDIYWFAREKEDFLSNFKLLPKQPLIVRRAK